jgi:hypothetical protein
MMLLMVMPSMACFQSICNAGKMGMGASMPGCHENMAHHTGGVVLMKDCMKNDLGQAAVLTIPPHEGAFIVLGLIALMLLAPLPRRGAMLRHIRPPPDPGFDPFDILLATQRFRN